MANKLNVLVVEDDASIRNLITTTLKAHEYKYLSAYNGNSALLEASTHNPDVILLDEATSALDSISETKIQAALEALKKNKTTFVVAHRLSTIKNADKIVVLKNGKIEEIGTYEQLMKKKGAFYEMKTLQN